MSIKVELFTAPGCSRCTHAKETLRRIVEEIGGNRLEWRCVEVLDEIDYAVSIGVLSTPAIAVDGVLVFTSLPSMRKLRDDLKYRIAQETVKYE